MSLLLPGTWRMSQSQEGFSVDCERTSISRGPDVLLWSPSATAGMCLYPSHIHIIQNNKSNSFWKRNVWLVSSHHHSEVKEVMLKLGSISGLQGCKDGSNLHACFCVCVGVLHVCAYVFTMHFYWKWESLNLKEFSRRLRIHPRGQWPFRGFPFWQQCSVVSFPPCTFLPLKF